MTRQTMDEALDAALTEYEILSQWSDDASRDCAVIEISGARRRHARVELDGELTLRSEGEDDAHVDPILA